ncbi:Gldg family protein [Halobellus rufus]|uniref:Gldg family protein n=1 Tax=Halobellus rufus TaxID=1448860 RepID=UPI0006791417|nr:hypothetical protein [Halobellus rufus]
MQARDFLAPAVTFVVVTAFIVGGAAVFPFLVGGDSPEVSNLAKQQTDLDSVRVADTEQSGEITMDSNTAGKTILIDQAHANQLSEKKRNTLVNTLVENGHTVRIVTPDEARGSAWNESLRSADALLVANPTQPYTADQLAGVRDFNDAGGRVLVLSDPASSSGSILSILGLSAQQPSSGSPGITSTLGVSASSGYLFNMHEYQANFKSVYATPEGGSLSDGVDRVVLRDAVAVSTGNGQEALTTIDQTKASTTRRTDTYAVAVQSDDVAMVGDTDFLAPSNAYVADNEAFIGNVADFLVSGQKVGNAPAPPTGSQSGTQATPPTLPR